MPNELYWIWLTLLFGYGTRRAAQVSQRIDHPRQLYDLSEEQLLALGFLAPAEARLIAESGMEPARKIYDKCRELDCQVITPDHPDYPEQLRHIYAKPLALYVKGNLDCLKGKLAIGMVGTRKMSAYGKKTADTLSYQLAKAGAVIVSGMAMGVDQTCHAGALKAEGKTIAVLGCGVDYNYPQNSGQLRQLVSQYGALVSELPPGSPPLPHNFPHRNRVISGLSHGVLVIEADARSGSLITAGHALAQDREVFAVPGPIDHPGSEGCNKLIKQGAKLVMEAMDVAEEFLYHWSDADALARNLKNSAPVAINLPVAEHPISTPAKPKAPPDYFSPLQLRLYETLSTTPRQAGELADLLELPVNEVLSALTELEIYGYANVHPGKRFSL